MHYLILILLVAFGIADAKFYFNPIYRLGERNLLHRSYTLCTYSNEAFQKCQQAVSVAESRFLDFPLQCVQKDTRDECIEAVRKYFADIIVLTGHNYEAARKTGLKPVIFERDSEDDFYIAVAPHNITVVAVDEAPIIVDQSNHRAFHAAIFFNLRRGHDICRLYNNALDSNYVKIVNSKDYTPNDEEILFCPDRSWAFAESFRECNFEASLQRAVFAKNNVPSHVVSDLKKRVFDVIIREFSHVANNKTRNSRDFDFFGTFHGQDNVIFKNNTIGFDVYPTYRNGVTEEVSKLLHCNADIGDHDASQLE